MSHIQQLHSQISTLLIQQLDSPAQTPSAPHLLSQLAESEPLAVSELTTVATNPVDKQQQSSKPTQQATSSSAATQQQPDVPISNPPGPPPMLCTDSEDIYWVNQLQTSLTNKGYYCGEEETEDFVFGSSTESAVMTFQVSASFLSISSCLQQQNASGCPGIAPTCQHICKCRLLSTPTVYTFIGIHVHGILVVPILMCPAFMMSGVEHAEQSTTTGNGSAGSSHLCLQACNGLEESGVVNEKTWKQLLGTDMKPSAPPVDVSQLLCKVKQ